MRSVSPTIEAARLIDHFPSRSQNFHLSFNLKIHRFGHKFHAANVLHLGPGAQRLARPVHGHVRVHSQRSLVHLHITHLQCPQNQHQFTQERRGLLTVPKFGTSDDLHQAHAGAIQVDETVTGLRVVQTFAAVLLQLDLLDRSAEFFRLFIESLLENDIVHPAVVGDGVEVLGDLVAGREVGVEIVLPIEQGHGMDFTI